jgi:membrane protein DedA with SNARE-associated domain
VLSPLSGWLHEHLYAVVLLGALVDAVGVPFPGRIMLITVGSLSGPLRDTGARASLVIALAVVGTVAGDHVWYLLGRLKGRRLLEAYCRLMRLSDARMAAADRLIRRYGALALLLSRVAATLRVVVIPLAVSRGMSYWRFVALDALGAFLWVAGFVWLGRVAGAVGAQSGLAGALAMVGALCGASILMSLLTRRWLARRASVS